MISITHDVTDALIEQLCLFCCFCLFFVLLSTCVSMSRLLGGNGGELTRLFTELLLASVSDLDSGLG